MRLSMSLGICLLSVLLIAEATMTTALGAQDRTKKHKPVPEIRLSLRAAMQTAVDQNPNVLISRERVNESKAASFSQLGALLPNFSGNATAANRRFFLGNFGAGIPAVSDDFDFYGTRAFVSQSLFSLSLIQRWRASRTGIDVAEFEFEATKRDTMATVALVYLEALSFEETVKARMANVQLNRELLHLAAERKSAGMATSLDVTRAKVQLETEKQRLVVARTDMGRSKLNLIRGMGIPFDTRGHLDR